MNAENRSVPLGSIDDLRIRRVHAPAHARLLDALGRVTREHLQFNVEARPNSFVRLNIVPVRSGSAAMRVYYFEEDEPRAIAIGAGVDAEVYVETDLQGRQQQRWLDFVYGFASGVLSGTLTEEISYRGDNIVHSQFSVDLGTEPFVFGRTYVGRLILGIGQLRRVESFHYLPYM